MYPPCPKHSLTFVNRSTDSVNLLQGFWQRDNSVIHESIMTVKRLIDSWYFGFGSPAVAGLLETFAKDTGGATRDTSMHGLIREQILDLVRLLHTCPLSDVRACVHDVLLDLKTKKGFRVPVIQIHAPSMFIPVEDMQHIHCLVNEPKENYPYFTNYVLFREHWFQWGRIENYITVMGYHPEYLECFIKLHDHLFHGDLPIPYPDRLFLALLAAAEQRCIYLVMLFARQFLSSGGNPVWLQGIQHAPAKWRQLLKLNRNLTNSPWAITSNDIYRLTRGEGSGSKKETISLSELMHAIVIMTQVHALACFTFACGILPEIDHCLCLMDQPSPQVGDKIMHHGTAEKLNPKVTLPCGCIRHTGIFTGTPLSSGNGISRTSSLDEKDNVNGRLKEQEIAEEPSEPLTPVTVLLHLMQADDTGDEVCGDIVAQQFAAVTKLNARLDSQLLGSIQVAGADCLKRFNEHPLIARFLEDPSSGYTDFDGQPFHVNEYSWPEEGCQLADRLCIDVGTLLDEKFRNAYDLTYNTLHDIPNVDTSNYRRTVWNHVQSLFGTCQDDFLYDRVDKLLTRPQRAFLKVCATKPACVAACEQDCYARIMPALTQSEVIHVLLMMMEARQQSCLLYALRAVSTYQTRGS